MSVDVLERPLQNFVPEVVPETDFSDRVHSVANAIGVPALHGVETHPESLTMGRKDEQGDSEGSSTTGKDGTTGDPDYF